MKFKLELKQWSGTWNNGTWENITHLTYLCYALAWSIHNIVYWSMLFCQMFHCSMCQVKFIVSFHVLDSVYGSHFGCSPLFKIKLSSGSLHYF